MAYGVKDGCFKEPNKEIRNATANVMCKCRVEDESDQEILSRQTLNDPDINKDLQKDNVVEPPKDLQPTANRPRSALANQIVISWPSRSPMKKKSPRRCATTGNVVTASDIQPVIIDDGLEPVQSK
ncbi:MAG: hypothetical protein U0892_13750 [Pirellulales bacterium]